MFSLAHIIMGYFSFLILSTIYHGVFNSPIDFSYMMWNILVGLMFEIIENTIFFRLNLKFGKRKDSLINSVMDIVFFTLAGFLGNCTIIFWPELLLFTSLLLVYIITPIMLILKKMTLRNK